MRRRADPQQCWAPEQTCYRLSGIGQDDAVARGHAGREDAQPVCEITDLGLELMELLREQHDPPQEHPLPS